MRGLFLHEGSVIHKLWTFCIATYSRDYGFSSRWHFPFVDFREQVKNRCPAFFIQEKIVDIKITFTTLVHGCKELINCVFVSIFGAKFLLGVELGASNLLITIFWHSAKLRFTCTNPLLYLIWNNSLKTINMPGFCQETHPHVLYFGTESKSV